MADLSTRYLGLTLKNPLVVAASPLSERIDTIKELADAGAAAIVLFSLFEEQIEIQGMGFAQSSDALPDDLRHVPQMEGYNRGVNGYLAHLYQARRAVNVPIIGSLNGYYSSGWVQYARLIEAAGADALELNVYYLPTRPQISGAEVEQMYLELVQAVKATVNIPVAVKISPYFSAVAHMAQRLSNAGADALVIFNRFYQPDIDLETETAVASLDLSTPSELRLRLRWAAILSSYLRADLAITGGVHSHEDVVKCMLAGARVAMMTSALLRHGPQHLSRVLADLDAWLTARNYDSIRSIQGKLNQAQARDTSAFERANYMRVLTSYGKSQ